MSVITKTGDDKAQLEALFREFNGLIDEDNLAEVLKNALLPIGTPVPTFSTTADTGFILLIGTDISRSGYARLFKKWGTQFGSGDGSTTFGTPDLRGRFLAGADSSAGRITTNNTIGAVGGEEAHTLTGAESGTTAHGHTGTVSAHAHAAGTLASPPLYFQYASTYAGGGAGKAYANVGVGGTYDTYNPADPVSGSTANATPTVTINNSSAANASSAHNNLPPYTNCNWQTRY